jgi:2-(1,2-epoxy-1,2-dihydrophenyl)acetyl-CoA isomerase
MRYETIELDYAGDGRIAVVRFARPEALNALDPRLADDLDRCLRAVEENAAVRAVVLTGKGKAFCAGGDLAAFKAAGDPAAFLGALAAKVHESVARMRAMRAPLVAAVNGACFGVGLSLACCCDLRLASSGATFCFGFTGVGLSPDSSLPYYLPRIVGHAKAAELAMLNPVLSAKDALDAGLVSRVTEPPRLFEEALATAAKIAAMPPLALGRLKRLLDAAFNQTLDEHLALELRLLVETAASRDFQEGCAAFAEKRKPSFEGR